MQPLPPVTQAILLSCVAFFCVDIYFLGLQQVFALHAVGSGFMPWQVLSYSFLHRDFAHLFFNMLGLWMFGAELERLWGPRRFAHCYFASVLTAAVAQLLLAALTGVPYRTVGASGGMYGLLLAYGLTFANRTIIPLFPPIPMKAITFVMIFIGVELILGVFGSNSGVAHFAHLGGMLGAWLLLRYWKGLPPFNRRRRR